MKKRKTRFSLIGSFCQGKAGSQVTRSSGILLLVWGAYIGFSNWGWAKIGRLAVIDQVLKIAVEAVIWLAGLLATEVVGHNSIVIYGLVIIRCVFSLT